MGGASAPTLFFQHSKSLQDSAAIRTKSVGAEAPPTKDLVA
ncbi:DUF6053 domain-containing protein [Lysobacter capsici]